MVALTVLLATVVVEAAPAGLLAVVGATRGFVAGKPVEVRVVADPVFAGPVVGLGVADTGALAAVAVGGLADVAVLGADAVVLAAASGFAVTGLVVAEEGLAAVEVLLAVAVVEVIVFFCASVVFASPLTSFFSVVEGAGFLSAVPTVLVRVVATFGDLAPTVDVLAAADGAGAVFFTAGGAVDVLVAVVGFAAGLVDVLAAIGAFLAATPVVEVLAVFATVLAA